MASSSEDEDAMDVDRHDASASRSRSSRANMNGTSNGRKDQWVGQWDVQRSWDVVTEGADGSIAATVEGLLEAGKRRRLLKDTTPIQRGIIRHLVLVLDLSSAMTERDLHPTRYILTLNTASDFITVFFEQNPISQLCLIGMRDGIAVRITHMSGNPAEHVTALAALRSQEPKGVPSLQNALDMARSNLFNSPSHGTREVVVVLGALTTSDPGDIHVTIATLVAESIRVSVVGLAARLAICQEICTRTHGVPKGDTSVYGISMDERHFRDLLFQYITPPALPARSAPDGRPAPGSSANDPSLLLMGFPSRAEEPTATPCACHNRLGRAGYACPRCRVKVCELPAQCPVCRLQLIQSTHLARSYHHLFPLRNYLPVSWDDVGGANKEAGGGAAQLAHPAPTACFGCLFPFAPTPGEREIERTRGELARQRKQRADAGGGDGAADGASESGRYQCPECGRHFCIDCDVFAHNVVHNCSGCLLAARDGEGRVEAETQ